MGQIMQFLLTQYILLRPNNSVFNFTPNKIILKLHFWFVTTGSSNIFFIFDNFFLGLYNWMQLT